MQNTQRLDKSINRALSIAADLRHEFLTPEHLLLAFTEDQQVCDLLKGAGANIETLRTDLDEFIRTKLASTVMSSPQEPVPSQSFRQMVQRAEIAIREAGKDVLTSEQMVISMLAETESTATYSLRHQGVTQSKVMNYYNYGQKSQPLAQKTEPAAPKKEKKADAALTLYAVDLNQKGLDGKIDPLVGRGPEIERILQIMGRRKKNNPLLVGDPGTGKTAIVEGLALRINAGDVPPELQGKTIYSLDMPAVLAGTRYRGDFEERMKAIVKEIQEDPDAILFIDEIHTVIGAGATSGGSMDASNIMKPALADGSMRCLGATTYKEFRNYFEKDAAMTRRFRKVDVAEPSIEEAVLTLNGVAKHYEKYHGVTYTPEAVRAAVELSAKFMRDRRLPDKAIDVLDEVAASQIVLPQDQRKNVFDVADIEDTISKLTNTPKKSVTSDETAVMAKLGDNLGAKVFGQPKAIEILVDAFQIQRAGLGNPDKPLGSYLFDGPTGVGKTELTKQLAEELGVNLLRFDMSEYMERHSVSRLIGAPPGYVGYDQGGLLTGAVEKSPFCVVLLDEIEKAHPDIFNILLQVMDHGALTDNNGKTVDFRNVILVMTTNVSANTIQQAQVGIRSDFSSGKPGVSSAVREKFPPEFVNRLDAVVPFGKLPREVISLVADKFLNQVKALAAAKNVTVERTEAVRDHLAKIGYDPEMGARPMERAVHELIKKPLSKAMLFGELVNGGSVKIDYDEEAKQVKFIFNAASNTEKATAAKPVLRLPAPTSP